MAAAFDLKRRLFSASILPDEDSYGRVVRGKIIPKFSDYGEPSERQRRQRRDAAIISLVGPIAESRFTGLEADEVGASGDRRQALELVEFMGFGSERQVLAFLDFLDVCAQDLVEDRQELIEAIAGALVERGCLSPSLVRQICREGD